MKTVVLQNVGRAGSAGTPLALKSFNAPAFDGIEVIAKREPPAASERTTLGPLLQERAQSRSLRGGGRLTLGYDFDPIKGRGVERFQGERGSSGTRPPDVL